MARYYRVRWYDVGVWLVRFTSPDGEQFVYVDGEGLDLLTAALRRLDYQEIQG